MIDWKPIETVPDEYKTSGKWILLKGGIPNSWEGNIIPPMVCGQFTHRLSITIYEEGWWQFAWYDGGYLGAYMVPTHWAECE